MSAVSTRHQESTSPVEVAPRSPGISRIRGRTCRCPDSHSARRAHVRPLQSGFAAAGNSFSGARAISCEKPRPASRIALWRPTLLGDRTGAGLAVDREPGIERAVVRIARRGARWLESPVLRNVRIAGSDLRDGDAGGLAPAKCLASASVNRVVC